MSYREKAHHWRSAFRQAGFNETWIKELRKEALKFLPLKVVAKVPQPYFSAAVRAEYADIGKSLEWNLTIDGDIGATGDYAFFFTATASNSILTPSQKSAAALLHATLEALEEKTLSDRLTQNILDALGGLDADAVNKAGKFTPKRKKGSLSTKTIYINQLVSMHPELCPKQLYPIADKSILDKGTPMQISTFDKKVSEARNPK